MGNLLANPRLLRFQVAARVASVSCILIGASALAAWIFDVALLKQALPGLVVMQPNSALAFVLAGLALWLRSRKSAGGGWKRGIAQGSAGAVLWLGLLTVAEHLCSWDLGIDSWLLPQAQGPTPASGQMTITTSLYFALAGLALLLLDSRPRAAQVLSLWALLIPLVVLIVYSYSTEAAQRLPFYTDVALNAVATFIALGVGILCARPECGVMALVASQNAGGVLVRRVLPAAIALQLTVGYLRLAGQYQGIYSTEFGMAVSAMAIVLGFALVVWGCARLLERMEARRRHAEEALRQANQTLEETNQKLKETQTQLVQSEKMASLGQLVAGIAHEINNPIAFVANNLFTSEEGLERITQQADLAGAPAERLVKIRKRLAEAGEGVRRVAELVRKLRTFSRLDEGEFKVVDIHESLDSVLLFLHHKMKERIQVEKHYGPHATLYCTGELNQVLMNLIANAVDAIEGEGKITITTGQREGRYFVSVKDTGKGIPAAVQEKIFEPFFTTKPVGQGTGLGLAIAHSIAQAHQGHITVHSEEGRGTEMVVQIPLDLEARIGAPVASN